MCQIKRIFTENSQTTEITSTFNYLNIYKNHINPSLPVTHKTTKNHPLIKTKSPIYRHFPSRHIKKSIQNSIKFFFLCI